MAMARATALAFAVIAMSAGAVAPGQSAPASPARVGPVLIAIPPGFAAAPSQKLKDTRLSAWTKSVRDGSIKTLLQVTVYNLGSHPDKTLSDQELVDGARQYLRQALVAVERRRAQFHASAESRIAIAGAPAFKATWNGAVGTRNTVGVMYSVILRGRYSVLLQTQDLGDTPSSGMLEAMQAIESIKVADP